MNFSPYNTSLTTQSFDYRRIAPTDLRDFAKSNGWKFLPEAVSDGLYVMSNPTFKRRQIIFPVESDAPDYSDAVSLAINKFAELMELSYESIILAIQEVKDDTLRFRMMNVRNESSYIPLSYAISAVNGAKDLFLSAASTVLKPQMHHPRLSRAEASQLLEATRFRHTETGSFILKVSSPVHSVETPGYMFDESIPFARQTTLTINQALTKLVNAVQADTIQQLVDDLKKSTQPDISSNLCKAITSFHEEHDEFDLSIQFDWAGILSLPPHFRVQNNIKIQKDYFSRIDEVRNELRYTEQQKNREDIFMASVEHLAGDIGPDGRRAGDVVLNLYQEEEVIKARTILTADQYLDADKAHMTPGSFIRIKGKLHQGNQPRLLSDVSIFDLILP